MSIIGIKMTLDGQREVSQGLKQVGNDVNALGNAGGKLGALGQGMDKAALSAGQLRMATQQLPLQFQDIVVSLQAGQQPLTVFLQQGSQIAGSFGGASAAAKAMAGYVLGLINPLTVAGVAVAGFGLALAGVEKSLRADSAWQAYADATGRGADLSVEAMKRLRDEMTQLPGVSKAMATGMLGDLVGMRDLSTKAFGDIALMAADVAVLMRSDVPTAAKELAKAMSDPAKGVTELNGVLRVLSAQQVATAQAMAEAGDKAGAQAYVLDQLKTATHGLATEGLTPLQKASNEFGNAWSDAMGEVGDGGPLQVANELMAGLVGHTADAVRWLGQLKPPAWLEQGAKGGLNGWVYRAIVGESKPDFTGGATGGWAPNTGGASGSWGGASVEGQTEWDRETESLIKAAAGYKTTAQAMSDLREQADKLQQKLQDMRNKGEADSELAKKTQSALDGVNARLVSMAKSANAGANSTKASYQSLLSAINQKIVAMQTEATTGEKLTETEKLRAKYQEELTTKGRQYTAAQREQMEARLRVLEVEETQAITQRELIKSQEEGVKAYDRLKSARERSLETLQQTLRAARDEEEAAALATASNITQAEALSRLAAARAEDAYLQALANGEAPATLDFLEREMRARRELIELMGQKGVREANSKAAKDAAREWEKVSQTIGDTLADYIMSGGKDAATYLKRLFSTLVLQPAVQTVVGGIMGAGVAGASGVAAGGSSAAGGLLNMASNAYSALTSPMLTNFGVGLAGNIQQLGGTLFSKGFEAFGTSVVDFGNTIAGFSNAINVAGNVFGYGSAIYNLSQGKFGSAAGAAIGTYFGGPIGAMIGSTLGGLVDSFFGSDRPESARLGGAYSTAGLNDYQVSSALGLNKDFKKAVESRSNAALDTAVQSLVMSITGAYNSLGKYTGDKKLGATAAFADEPNLDDRYSWAAFQLFDELTGKVLANWNSGKALDPDGEKAFAVLSGKMSAAMVAELKSADIPGWMHQVLDSLGSAITLDGLSGAMQQIALIDAAFEGWKDAVVGFESLNGVVQTTLLNVSGGLETLATNVSGYYQNFYSEQERAAVTTRQLTEALAKYGVALPSSKEDFRELIEQQLAAGDAGAELAAVLLDMQGIFASVATTWATELDGMAKEVGDFFGAVHESIAGVTADVQATRQSILRGNGAMTASEIQAAITAAIVQAPSTAASIAAQGGVATAAGTVAIQQTQSNTAVAKFTSTQELLSKAQAERDAYAKSMNAVRANLAVNQDQLDSYIDGKRSHYGSRRTNIGYFSGRVQNDQAKLAAMQPQFDAYNAAVAAQQAALDAATASAKANADALAAAKTALDAAQKAQADALTAYASEVAKYVADASTSVGKLSELRGEVESFYAAQAQAVQAMLQSAGNIRNVADQVRLSQLTNAQTAQELGARYAMDYSMALATTGSTRAGYVDSMAGNLQSLSNAMKVEASSSAEWQISVGKLLAQASNAANLLDGDAKNDDYQDVALGLLDSIDTALEGLSTATKSAEQVIADAIAAGTQAQLEGLRAIVAALKGEAIPGFASGGMHLGGLRIVGENGPELEATGPSRIWNAQQMAYALGGGMDSAAGMKAVLHEVQISRNEDRAHLLAILDVLEPFLRLAQRWDVQGFPGTRPGEEVTA